MTGSESGSSVARRLPLRTSLSGNRSGRLEKMTFRSTASWSASGVQASTANVTPPQSSKRASQLF